VLLVLLCQSWVMRKLFPLTLLTWQRSRHPGPSLAISAQPASQLVRSINCLCLSVLSGTVLVAFRRISEIPAIWSGSIASGTPPLNNSKSGLVTVPHTPVSRQATVPPIHIIPAPPRRSLVSAAAFRSALKTARVYGVTTTPELKQYHQSPSY